MIILVTGMVRSGSTWSYNVALEIAKYFNAPIVCGYAEQPDLEGAIEGVVEGEVGVFKCHTPNKKVIDRIAKGWYKNIMTVRHPLDCVASRRQFRPNESALESINMVKVGIGSIWSIINTSLGNRRKQFVFRYEDMMDDPDLFVSTVGAYLGFGLDPEVVRKISAKTGMTATRSFVSTIPSLPDMRREGQHLVDPETCLHDNHIQDGKVGKYAAVLKPMELQLAKKMLEKEIRFLGYTVKEER